MTVRRKDGLLYEPDTLSSFQRSIDRHLTKDLHNPYSIIHDTQFAPSREKLKASRKFLKGKGAEPVDVAEVEQMWQQGALGASDPVTLQQMIWWLISTQMGTRGCDEHHKFKFGDFQLKKASDGTGETEKSTNADTRVFKPKMWATPDRPERCPVRIFQQYVDRRPPEMCQEDSPFYLSINHKHKPGSYWYKKLPLGIHKVDGMMKNLAKDGSLTGKKTNHSARKTQVQTLCAANVADSAVMQLSGHKSVQSLNHYKRPSLQQEKHMSYLLSNYKQSPPPIATAAQPSVNYAMSPDPIVSKAHLPLVNQAVQSHPPIVCQDEAGSPVVQSSVKMRLVLPLSIKPSSHVLQSSVKMRLVVPLSIKPSSHVLQLSVKMKLVYPSSIKLSSHVLQSSVKSRYLLRPPLPRHLSRHHSSRQSLKNR